MTIECMEFKPHNNKNLIGFANFWVPKMGLEIYGCSLHQKEGRRWLNLPSREYKDAEGVVKYMPVIRFRDKDHYNAFIDACKRAIDAWCAENAPKEKAPKAVEPVYQDDPLLF